MPRELQVLDAWRRHLLTELTMLPQTLTDLREGVDNFRRITQRLSDATDAFDQISAMQAGAWADLRGRLENANRTWRDQVGTLPGGDRMAGALQDLNESLAAVVRLNPFLGRAFPKQPPE